MQLRMTIDELAEFIDREFPQVADQFAIDRLAPLEIELRLKVDQRHLRPGGTVSGPSMFTLADCAIYLAILGMIGPRALAVTTNASFDFMRKPAANTDLVAKTRLLKLGRSLAVGDALLYSVGQEAPVARASMTYAIPPEKAPE